jgi:hypothetical protein
MTDTNVNNFSLRLFLRILQKFSFCTLTVKLETYLLYLKNVIEATFY